MRKNVAQVGIGLFLILAGVLYIGRLFGLWDIGVFFDGWWTLFIIIPAILAMTNNGINFGNVIMLSIGALLLLDAQGILQDNIGFKLIFPVIIIAIGANIIFTRNNSYDSAVYDEVKKNNSNQENILAIFGGNEQNYTNKIFTGVSTCAIFGGVELDLRNAIIEKDCVIETCDIFGGTDISLPTNVKVRLNVTPIFGGVENNHISSPEGNAPTVYINSTCIFGGAEIK